MVTKEKMLRVVSDLMDQLADNRMLRGEEAVVMRAVISLIESSGEKQEKPKATLTDRWRLYIRWDAEDDCPTGKSKDQILCEWLRSIGVEVEEEK